MGRQILVTEDTHPDNVTFSCPLGCGTEKYCACTVNVPSGSLLIGVVNWTSTSTSKEFVLSGEKMHHYLAIHVSCKEMISSVYLALLWDRVALPVSSLSSKNFLSGSYGEKDVLHLINMEFQHGGMLHSFELYASNIGTVNVLVRVNTDHSL